MPVLNLEIFWAMKMFHPILEILENGGYDSSKLNHERCNGSIKERNLSAHRKYQKDDI